MNDLATGLSFLLTQSEQSFLHLFWYTLVFELPRYGFAFVALGAIAVCFGKAKTTNQANPARTTARDVSVIVVGHNEAEGIEACVRSLREQSIADFELVVVSDGSSDRMVEIARRLQSEGLVDQVLSTALRGGKSSGINLAIGACRGDIIVNVDCDCSYDRFAIEEILAPFRDPAVGAVSGDIVPRNGDRSLVAQFQEIEYLIGISVGKRISDALDQVVCVSGAFGAFRREALDQVGAFDVGAGEDLDLTMRLRRVGWRVVFASEAICYTDVPVDLWPLIRQRLRWERDSVRLRYRKYRSLMSPRSARFRPAEAFHQWDFLIYSVLGAIAFPAYVIWLFAMYGSFAIPILVAMQFGLFAVDAVTLLLAELVTRRPVFWRNLPYLVGHSIFTTYVMRMVRLWAYVEEWMLFASTRDNYVPQKVRAIRKW